MIQNVYEGLFILDSDLYAKAPDEVAGQISTIVEQATGEVLLSRLWDERKLAYPIKGHKRGTYWLTYFKLDPLKVKELTRQFQLNNNIIRFLILKVDKRLVDMLVEHARAGHLFAGEHSDVEQDKIIDAGIDNFAINVDEDDEDETPDVL
ncbi:MAG: 30S ribosomal protein S6 [Planctomycetaceae bacterium]|jgi:small subunit ribosomal protein S6|nr:30S ribosomal protein S6 [Planctomycetaceae bacterium]